jgi:hypothetical protein
MTKASRARKKANHRLRHQHPAHAQRVNPDHPAGTPLPVLCPACRPGKKKWDRSQAGKAA